MNVPTRVHMGTLKQSSKPTKPTLKTLTSITRLTITLFLSIMSILIHRTTSTPASNMTLNSKLVASENQTLLSPGGVFEVGFTVVSRPPDGASHMIYTLAIWYAQILSATSGRTIVWMADRSMNLSSSNATMQLSAQGNLEVYNDGNFSERPLWSSSTSELNVSLVAMQDTGNLVLLNNLNQIVWQSFDNPTDTLLPGQQYVASANISMYAWQKDDNYTRSGCHVLKWGPNGLLMVTWMSPRVWLMPKEECYWNSSLASDYVVLTTEGQFLAKSSSDNRTAPIIASSADVNNSTGARLNRLTFDYDGILRMYSWDVSRGSGNSWSVVWTGNSICSVWNYCGPYSICENNNCICTEGFQFLDVNDPTQGCTRSVEFTMACTANATSLQMIGYALIDYPFGDNLLQPFVNVSLSFCLQTCLDSCTCEACVYAEAIGYCWLKSTLLNGQTSYWKTTYIKFAAQQSHSQETSPLSASLKKKLLIAFPSLGGFTLTLATLLCTIGWFAARRKANILRIQRLEEKWTAAKGLIVSFTYDEIQLATKNFAHQIGKGGAGTVFKAEFGKHAIAAVKRLDNLHHAEVEKGFLNEIETIGLIRHVNLVELHGYCTTADHKLLVYEYLENSSLDKKLFCKPDGEHVLEWRCRYKIALQTARAVNFLHEDQGRGATIIHCDIKPENILLDSAMSAKVADFGLARILNWERTRTLTAKIHGTPGYMAPEWTQAPTPITTKIDVFSFGMVLLEIVSGRRNLVEADIHKPDWYFPLWAVAKLDSGSYMELVDPSLTQIADPKEVERALLVAFWCIHEQPEHRPSMSDVVQMLEGNLPITLPVPRPKFLEMLMIGSTTYSLPTPAGGEASEPSSALGRVPLDKGSAPLSYLHSY